jgi:hypothetical protein
VDAKHDKKSPLPRRCSYSVVWANSASLNREGVWLALVVQPLEALSDLWPFRMDAHDALDKGELQPATTNLDLVGYAEFTGWVRSGKQVLMAREARGRGSTRRA